MTAESETPTPEEMGFSKEAIDFDAAKAKTNLESKNEKDYFRQPADSAFAEEKLKFSELEPLGEVVLGKIDPRFLTEEEFNQSPELLYHGSKKADVDFDDSVDYTSIFLESQLGSNTVGNGFYTTPEVRNAEIYSEARQQSGSEANLQRLLPFQAKMLDMRASTSPRINAPVTAEFAQEWLSFYQDYFKSEFPTGVPDLEGKPISEQSRLAIKHSTTSNYLTLLKERVASGNSLNLRSLLDRSEYGRGNDTDHAATLFTRFMLHKGYDGLIYNEGGDKHDQKHTTSVVFFNPKKLGAYQTWQARR